MTHCKQIVVSCELGLNVIPYGIPNYRKCQELKLELVICSLNADIWL